MSPQSRHYRELKQKWTARHGKLRERLWQKHGPALDWLKTSTRNAVVGSAAGFLLFTNPLSTPSATLFPTFFKKEQVKPAKTVPQLVTDLKTILPGEVVPLTPQQETQVAQELTDYFNIPVAAELQGKRLNRSYGLIGAEQHLTRYPGDTIDTHFDTPEEAKYISSGMAPGRGAWGYFTDSAGSLTELDKQREKYYIAVPTFLAPGWNADVKGHYAFFKYRKMLVVNPENGKAIVADIGDSGPAEFTGKHLGGSPEVMAYLQRVDGAAKGPVLYFFIDDPENKVGLGPVSIQ